MELLQYPENREYPTEYLLARIRGRRVYLLREWDKILFSPDPVEYLLPTLYGEFITEHSLGGVWKRLLKEFKWVYLQMNKGLRDVFHQFFLYSEIKTLILCFRNKIREKKPAEVEHLLSFSLLSEEVKAILEMEAELPSVLEVFEKRPLFPSIRRIGLKDVFLKDGLIGVEQKLTGAFLEQIISSELHPVIKRFFIYKIDTKNIITIYKYLRWGVKADPLFVNGGSIGKSRLTRVINTRETSEIAQLIYQLSGLRVKELRPPNFESTLLRGLTKKIKIMGREYADIGFILDYLWRCSVEVKNLSIILYGREIDRNILKEELVT